MKAASIFLGWFNLRLVNEKIKFIFQVLILGLIFLPPGGKIVISANLKLGLDHLLAFTGLIFVALDICRQRNKQAVHQVCFFLALSVVFLLLALPFTRDFSYLKHFLFLSKNVLRFYLFVSLSRKFFKEEKLATIVGWSLIPFLVVTFILQSSPFITEWYLNFIGSDKNTIQLGLNTLRVSWSGLTSWEYSILFFISFTFYFISHPINKIEEFMMSGILLLGASIYGRSWIVGFAILVLLFLIREPKKILKLFLILFLVMTSTFIIYHIIIDRPRFFLWTWEFLRFGNKEVLAKSSFADLSQQNATFVQNTKFDLKKILFGHGKYTYLNADGELRYFGDRDSGYIRQLLCVGFIYSCLLYGGAIYFFLKSLLWKTDRILILFMALSLLIYQWKGDILFYYLGIFFLFELGEIMKKENNAT